MNGGSHDYSPDSTCIHDGVNMDTEKERNTMYIVKTYETVKFCFYKTNPNQ